MHTMTLPARRLGFSVFLAVAALAAAPAVHAQGALVGVDEVQREPLAQTQPVIGRFVARQAGDVAARTAGSVTEMRVLIGDRVAKGDVLAVLDMDRLSWQRDLVASTAKEMNALVESANAALMKRRQDLTRLEGIRESAAFSQARYDDAVQDLLRAEAGVAAAAAVRSRVRANLKIAQDDLKHGKVMAPYTGVVSRRHTEVGAYVNVGEAVVSLVNETDLEIEADVPYNRIAGLQPGTIVTITLADRSSHNAVVRATGAEENAMTRTRLVRFTPDIAGATVPNAVGESLSVMLPLGAPREVVTVHKDAILKRQGLSLVYVMDAESKAQIRPVELGEAVGPRFVVLGGVEPGEIVVIRGNERLRPGQDIQIGEPAPAEEAAGES
jgi:RND family efflux transporter MFP subunit